MSPIRLGIVLGALALAGTVACPDEPSSKKDELKAYDARIKATDRQHWSYGPVQAPAIPKVHDIGWVRNPIDNFVLARLEKEKLKPSPEADKITLLRRLSLDLIGLPPTIAEIDAFLADKSPGASSSVVQPLHPARC